MMNKRLVFGLTRTWQYLLGSALLTALLTAADTVPVLNSGDLLKGEKLEVEQVEINRLSTGPSEIHRTPGRFLLMVTNKSKDPDAVYALEPQTSDSDPLQQQIPTLQFGGPRGWGSRGRLSSLVNAPRPGTWLLKSASTGRTLCTITIDK